MENEDTALLIGLAFCVAGLGLMALAVVKTRDWMLFALGAAVLWLGVKGME